MNVTVLGLDLSMTGTGIAYGDTALVVKTDPDDGDERLDQIVEAVLDQIDGQSIDLAVVEDLPTHAKAAGITGMVHGAVRRALRARHVPYALVPPASLKKYATGKGNAPKPDLRMALYKRTGIDEPDDNRVDARWLRMMGLDFLGAAEVKMPETQRAALDGVRWPAEIVA